MQQVCVGLYWMVASQLQNSSHHLVTIVFPTFETVGLVTEDIYAPPVLGWSLVGAVLGYARLPLGQLWLRRDMKVSSPHTCTAQQMEGESFKRVDPRTKWLWPLFKFANSRSVGPRPQEVLIIPLAS